LVTDAVTNWFVVGMTNWFVKAAATFVAITRAKFVVANPLVTVAVTNPFVAVFT